jgi:5'-phosphate synthase pdxT subunit
VEVRLPEQLADGRALPAGDDQAVKPGKLAATYSLLDGLRGFVAAGRPVYGTCAGLIMLARTLDQGQEQPLVGGMDIAVRRNAFGRQAQSFERFLDIPALGEGGPFRAVFIRAPLITAAGGGVEVLAQLPGGGIVAARQGALLASAFHPELADDARLHRYFLAMCRRGQSSWREEGVPMPARGETAAEGLRTSVSAERV